MSSLLRLFISNRQWRTSTLIFLLSFNFTYVTTAQNIVWDKTIGGADDEELATIQPTRDGGYILGGFSESGKTGDKTILSKGDYDYWVVKLNADGSKAWDKSFGGKGRDYLMTVQQTQDGGYILGGTSESGKSGDKTGEPKGVVNTDGRYPPDFWIVKISVNGTKEWDKTLGTTGYDYSFSSLVQTPDGGYLLGANTELGISGDKTQASKGSTDIWLIKLNASGNKLWDKTLGGSGPDNIADLQLAPDGGYLIGASSNSGISGDKSQASKGFSDFWLLKLKADGSKLWDKTIGGNLDDGIGAVRQTADGGYLLAGSSSSGISGDKSEANIGKSDSNDFWVVKLKANGTKEWDNTIGGNGREYVSSLQLTPDGGYILGGTSDSDVSGDKTAPNLEPTIHSEYPGVEDYWVVKLKADGSKQWDKTLGGTNTDRLASILQTRDGGFVAGGTSMSRISIDKSEDLKGGRNYGDFWIVKLDNAIGTRKEQIITFNPIVNQNVQDSPLTLQATSTSGLPVSFSVVSGPATVKNNQLTLTGTGTITIKALQAGNATYGLTAVSQRFQAHNSPVSQVWNKTYGGVITRENPDTPGLDHCQLLFGAATLQAMVPTPDGGYLLGGTSDSRKGNDKGASHRGVITDGCYGEGDIKDYWIIKINANGQKLWDKTFGGDQEEILTSLIATRDGGYLLGGISQSGKSGDKSEPIQVKGDHDYWLVKIDAAGNKLWDKTLGTPNFDYLTAMIATPDGGYLLGDDNFSLTKIDATGKLTWRKSVSNPTDPDFKRGLDALLLTPDGNYLLGGTSYKIATEDNYRVLKLDTTGNIIWDKSFGGSDDDNLEALVIAPDGGYLLGGSSESSISGDKTEDRIGLPINRDPDFWLIKIDSKGNKVWDKTLGTRDHDYLTALVTTPDGGYLVGGYQDVYISDAQEDSVRRYSDYLAVKINAQGQKEWDKFFGGYLTDNLSSIIVDGNGDYVLGGTSYSDIGGDKSEARKGLQDYWVIKISEKTKPATTWNMRYGGNGTDNLTTLIKTTDGGYLSGGYTNSAATGDKTQTSQGKNDYWIVKSDKNGKKLWDKRYGGTGEDYLNSVLQTQDGGYLLAGSSFSPQSGDKSQVSRGGRDFWIVKINAQGNKQWDKRYGGTGQDELKKVMQLASGRYLLAGTSNSPVSGDKSKAGKGRQDYWLLKIEPDGQKVWDRCYGGSSDDFLEDLALATDGNFLLGGSSTSGANGDRTQANRGRSDFWVLRLDGNGEKIWDYRFGSSGEDKLMALGTTPAGNLYLAGTTASSSGGDLTNNSRGLTDYWLIEITNTGTKVWDRLFGGNLEEELRAVQVTSNGNYLLAGSSRSGIWLDKTQPSQGGSDYWVVEANRSGVIGDQRYGGSEDEELRAIVLTNDSGYLLAGRSGSGVSGDRTQPRQGSPDYWLIKSAEKVSSIVAARTSVVAEEPVSELATLSAYPNPFQEKVTVNFTLPETQATTVRVLDSQGKEITTLFQGEAKANQIYQVEWQAGNKPAGMYLLQLQTLTKQNTQKLLLRK